MAAIVVALAGCEALDEKGDYYRHTMSSFGNSRTEPGVLVFEATTSGLYPVESAEAEAQRVEWLEGCRLPSRWSVTSWPAAPVTGWAWYCLLPAPIPRRH
jgi:hypothetical protein